MIEPTTINGVGGSITTSVMGYLGLYGPAFYAKDFKHNILSVSRLCDASCIPQFIRDPDMPMQECLRISHPDFHDRYFQLAGGLYLCDFPAARHNPLDDLELPLPLMRIADYPAVAIHDSDMLKHFT